MNGKWEMASGIDLVITIEAKYLELLFMGSFFIAGRYRRSDRLGWA